MDENIRQVVALLQFQDDAAKIIAQKMFNSAGGQGIGALADALYCSNITARRNAAQLLSERQSPVHFQIMTDAVSSEDLLVAEIAVHALECYADDAVDALVSKLDNCNCL